MKKNITSWITILLFFACLAAVPVLGFLQSDAYYSKTENRSLQQRPVNDFSDLSALTENYTSYVVDQFPERERLLKFYTALELVQGKAMVRDAFIADGGYLMAKTYTLSGTEAFAWELHRAAVQNPEVDFVYTILPVKNYILEEASPYAGGNVAAANREALLTALTDLPELACVDVSGYLRGQCTFAERKDLFYRTDFHWNTYGAFVAAEYIGHELETLGLLGGAAAPTAEDFLWEELGDSYPFMGDLNRRFSYLFSMNERIPNYSPRDTSQLRYYLSADASSPVERTEIVGSELDGASLSYNGLSTYNLGYYQVENPNARSERRVVILKDSYQNPTTDYFTELFAHVTVIDPRYCEEGLTLSTVLAQTEADLVLFMYHQSNISVELRSFITN